MTILLISEVYNYLGETKLVYGPINIHSDNQVNRTCFKCKRTKHVDTGYHLLQEMVTIELPSLLETSHMDLTESLKIDF